jgi:tRNA threonylcarbamoyl adenosine modification protein YeaZ
MLVAVVDSATPAVTAGVALVDPTGRDAVTMLAEHRTVDPKAHGELLAPAVARVLAAAGIAARDLAAVVAGVGPGPFTGLRAGLALATALGQGLDIPTYGVCSLDGIGAFARATTLVATDARRKEVYWALYRDGARVTGPAVDRPEEVARQAAAQWVSAAAGEGAMRYAQVLGVPVFEPMYPSVRALVERAAPRIRLQTKSEALVPLYLRRPDAAVPHAPKAVLP